MEKCPKCGHWTVALDIRRKVLTCYQVGCDHEETVDVDKYLEEHNTLPKLVESLRLNGYDNTRKISVRT